MRTTNTFAELEIPASAWDAIIAEIAKAGAEYLERYLHDDKTIVFTGSEVGLVRREPDIREHLDVV